MYAVTQSSLLTARFKPLMDVDIGLYLLAIDLVRCLQQRIAQAISNGKVRACPPGILHIQLHFIGLEVARHQGAGRLAKSRCPVCQIPVVVIVGDVADQPGQVHRRVVVRIVVNESFTSG